MQGSDHLLCQKNNKALKDDIYHVFCSKSVRLGPNFLTLGVTSDSVSEVNSFVEILVLCGEKRLLGTFCLYYLKRYWSNLVALTDLMRPLYNVPC